MIRLCYERPRYPCLIVTANIGLCDYWKTECRKWVNGVKVLIINSWTACLLRDIGPMNVFCITSYNQLSCQKEVRNFVNVIWIIITKLILSISLTIIKIIIVCD